MSHPEPPLPPRDLAEYVGNRDADPLASYVEIGAAVHGALVDLLDRPLDGRRVLDFGCGSGRVLRHFLADAGRAELHGCDIHPPSIDWLRRHVCPPVHAHLIGPEPPLPFADGYFNIAWAMSVFTHLTDSWARWLAELHRVLEPDGIAIVSVLSRGYYEHIAGEPWDEDCVGMTVFGPGRPWEAGGPMVAVSPWWLRAHWGRAFHLDRVEPEGFAGVGPPSQGIVVMRPRSVAVTAELLAAPEPTEPRELTAALHAVELLQRDYAALNRRHDEYAAAYQHERAMVAALTGERDSLRRLAERPSMRDRLRSLIRREP
jgi:SAM-dependent methyltransferase